MRRGASLYYGNMTDNTNVGFFIERETERFRQEELWQMYELALSCHLSYKFDRTDPPPHVAAARVAVLAEMMQDWVSARIWRKIGERIIAERLEIVGKDDK